MVKNKYKIIPQNHEDSKELLKSWVNFYVIAFILRSDARCSAQCSEYRRSDGCYQLHDKLCGFLFRHNIMILVDN